MTAGLDYDAWRFWWDVLQTLLTGAIGVYVWLLTRTRVNKSAIDRVDGRVSEIQARVTLLENDVRHLPDHEDLGELHEKVNSIANGMGEIRGELHSLNRTLSLINEHLLNGGRG